jgi:hypothetical protein
MDQFLKLWTDIAQEGSRLEELEPRTEFDGCSVRPSPPNLGIRRRDIALRVACHACHRKNLLMTNGVIDEFVPRRHLVRKLITWKADMREELTLSLSKGLRPKLPVACTDHL